MAIVLCVGADRAVMEARRMILEQAGHTVVQAMSIPEIADACTKHRFEVAVIGQMIVPAEKQRAFAAVRQHSPATKVLSLHLRLSGKLLPDADDWMETPTNVPGTLAERVSRLAKMIA
jgi:DNA-binding NtrC family response regulator